MLNKGKNMKTEFCKLCESDDRVSNGFCWRCRRVPNLVETWLLINHGTKVISLFSIFVIVLGFFILIMHTALVGAPVFIVGLGAFYMNKKRKKASTMNLLRIRDFNNYGETQ